MAEIIHRVGIRANEDKVFKALATIDGLAGWWTADTTGRAEPGKTIDFQFQDAKGQHIGGFRMAVLKQEPRKQVQWQVKEGPDDWLGTEISFDLKREDDYTIVMFAHRKWAEPSESMAHCSLKWGTFLLSLKDFVETGKGHPAPHDVRISNWH